MQCIKTVMTVAGIALIGLSSPCFAVMDPIPVSEDGTIVYVPEVWDGTTADPGDSSNYVLDKLTGEAIDCQKDPQGCKRLLKLAEDRKKPKTGGTTPPTEGGTPPTTGGTPPTTGGATPPTTNGGTPPSAGGAAPTGDSPKTGGGATPAGGGATGGGTTSGGGSTSSGSESSSNKRTTSPNAEDGTTMPRVKGNSRPRRPPQ